MQYFNGEVLLFMWPQASVTSTVSDTKILKCESLKPENYIKLPSFSILCPLFTLHYSSTMGLESIYGTTDFFIHMAYEIMNHGL